MLLIMGCEGKLGCVIVCDMCVIVGVCMMVGV